MERPQLDSMWPLRPALYTATVTAAPYASASLSGRALSKINGRSQVGCYKLLLCARTYRRWYQPGIPPDYARWR